MAHLKEAILAGKDLRADEELAKHAAVSYTHLDVYKRQITYELSVYEEHAISRGSNSKAATYVGIVHDGKMCIRDSDR